jgi:excisionase family DNA binding protein
MKKLFAEQILYTVLTKDEIELFIGNLFKEYLLKNTKPTDLEPVEFITRRDTANILGISLPTLHKWTLDNIIKSYRIGTRIRYKKNEVIESLSEVSVLKQGGLKK